MKIDLCSVIKEYDSKYSNYIFDTDNAKICKSICRPPELNPEPFKYLYSISNIPNYMIWTGTKFINSGIKKERIQ